MRREDRYFVLKRKDINSCLTSTEHDILLTIEHKIIKYRKELEKAGYLRCVVVEEDWPEYEKVWAMIEARVAKEKGEKRRAQAEYDLDGFMPSAPKSIGLFGSHETEPDTEDKDQTRDKMLHKAETDFQEIPDYTGKCPIPGYKSVTLSVEQIKAICEGLSEFSGRFDVQVIDPNGHEPEPDTVDD